MRKRQWFIFIGSLILFILTAASLFWSDNPEISTQDILVRLIPWALIFLGYLEIYWSSRNKEPHA